MERMPDLDFLLKHSHVTLCELELASLSRSSNALKRAKEEMDEAVAQREVAGVVRWLMENREVLLEAARRAILPAKGEPWTTPFVGNGETASHTFTEPGTYQYFCRNHGQFGMVGTITVVQ